MTTQVNQISEWWRPRWEAQKRFHEIDVYEKFYGGAAGGGKTDTIMREALRQIKNPNYRCVLFRRSYPEIRNTFLPMAYKWYLTQGLIPKLGGMLWQFPKGGNILFAHLNKERDVYKYKSTEFTVIGFDELTSFTEFQYEYMKSRNRTTDKTLKKYILSGSNPDDVGHVWVKARFIDVAPPNKIYTDNLGNTRIFIPSMVMDNVVLMENDPNYVRILDAMPEKQRKALRDGDWDAFEGQYFTEWNRDIHSIKPFYPINGIKKRAIGMDWGSSAPACVLWAAMDNQDRIFVYRELYETGHLYNTLAKKIVESTQGIGDNNIAEMKEIGGYAIVDPSIIGSKDPSSGMTADDEMMAEGLKIYGADNSRVNGWNLVRKLLHEKKLFICDNCLNLVRTLPQMIHDRINVEDLNTKGEDHAVDALRYLCMYLYDGKIERFEKRSKSQEQFIGPRESSPVF